MRWHRSLLATSVAFGTALLAAPSAYAVGLIALPAAIPGLVLNQQECQAAIAPAFGVAAQSNALQSANALSNAAPNAMLSKSAAILGGRVSKLDLIAAQQGPQADLPAGAVAGFAAAAVQPRMDAGQVPAAQGINCVAFARAAASPRNFQAGQRPDPLGSEDFLASRRLAVAKTTFDPAWERVSTGRVPSGVVHPMAGLSGQARLAAVNAWANDHIRYAEDRDLYGRADFWAPAAATIMTGAGDCEDIAIVKMQMLAALGVDRSDMFLTVARDRVRNTDHALLIVKADGKFWMLDNATNMLLDASQNYDYLPVLTFSQGNKWLHGF